MFETLRRNVKDPYRRRMLGARLGGKMIGLGAVVGVIYGAAWFASTPAGASVLGQTAVKAADVINPINTMWTIIAAFLVFLSLIHI